MYIKKSTTYTEFVDLMNKTKKLESMRVTPTVSVVCVNNDYYEIDVHKQTFGKLNLVGAMSYKRGTAIPQEQLATFRKMPHDIEASLISPERCKIYRFRRVNMFN